jgi:ArsR family transcriptional regulator
VASLDDALDALQLFADPTRLRLMALLSRHELTVFELTAVTGLAQPRVSTHLGKLREAGLLLDRKQGQATFYRASDGASPEGARKLWALLEGEVRDAVIEGDRRRCEQVLRARSGGWPEALAGEMERHYSPGRTWQSLALGLAGLLRLGDVVDLGSGDGAVAQLLAPRAKSVTCVDASDRMIAAAAERLRPHPSARAVVGDVEALPFADASFDEALLLHTLVCVESPARALAEAARVLRPGGRAVVATLDAHDHPEATAAYRHRHPGFAPAALRRLLTRAGLRVVHCASSARERRPPFFQTVTAFADKPEAGEGEPPPSSPRTASARLRSRSKT